MWSNVAIAYLLVYLALGILVFIPGVILQYNKEKRALRHEPSNLTELTVVIPFRNEREHLPKLLSSFNKSKRLPFAVFFVNDHSEDDGVGYLTKNLKDDRFVILNLPTGTEGKKEAIRFALNNVMTSFVLTMDADIQFSTQYFVELEKLNWKEMEVLPVIMHSNHFIGRLAEMDHLLVNALNMSASGWNRPFIASGANLLFRKSSFALYDRFELHKHIASGDDVYLLRDFRKAKAAINVNSSQQLSVTTSVPNTLIDFFEQRIRWAAKTGDVKDRLADKIIVLQVLLTLNFAIILTLLIIHHEWNSLLYFWFSKSLLDILLFLPYTYRTKRSATLLWMPFYELLYPIYALTLASVTMLHRPTWKGRAIRAR